MDGLFRSVNDAMLMLDSVRILFIYNYLCFSKNSTLMMAQTHYCSFTHEACLHHLTSL